MSAKMSSALSSYSDYGYNSEIEYASPHRLVQMLFEGALKRIAFAKGAIQRKEIAEKGKFIGQAIGIVEGLKASLDKDAGGEIATTLEALYDYICRQLLQANIKDNEDILDEVSGLLSDVKIAWDAINGPENIVPQPEVVKPAEIIEPMPINKPAHPVNSRANKALKAYSI